MPEKVKTIDEFKKDLQTLAQQFEQVKQQVALTLGAKLYVEQEIAKLEKVEEVKVNGT